MVRPHISALFPYTTLFRSIGFLGFLIHVHQSVKFRLGLALQNGLKQLAALAQRFHMPHPGRSEEHTSELQSPCNLVCRLLLEKKNKLTQILGGSANGLVIS